MKRCAGLVLIFILCVLAGGKDAVAREGIRSKPSHSISLSTLYGLEYGYEHPFGDVFYLSMRVGAGSELYRRDGVYAVSTGAGLTVEPRFYLNREDFIAVRLDGDILFPNTPMTVELVPVYGVKRLWSEHWFCEFTIGAGLGYYSGVSSLYFKPHMQFRIGLAF